MSWSCIEAEKLRDFWLQISNDRKSAEARSRDEKISEPLPTPSADAYLAYHLQKCKAKARRQPAAGAQNSQSHQFERNQIDPAPERVSEDSPMILDGNSQTEMLSPSDMNLGDPLQPVLVEWDEGDERFLWLGAPNDLPRG